MSTSRSVRNRDPDTVQRLKRRAAAHGRSAEAEVREILRASLAGEAEPGFADLAAELRSMSAGRRHTTAEEFLREARGAR
jgi:plasmid stability protein